MAIAFQCTCGKTLKAPDGSEGRRARCPRCGAIATVPYPQFDLAPGSTAPPRSSRTAPALQSMQPAAPATPAAEDPMLRYAALSKPARSLRSYAYLLLVLALIPLVLSTFHTHEDTADRLEQSVQAHPEVTDQVAGVLERIKQDEATEDDLIAVFPGNRLDGALLARDSKAHWLMALGAAAGFFGLLLVAFSNAAKYAKGLLFAALFTGTVGVILLLVFQFAAFSMPVVIPRGIFGLVLLIIKLIGMSYALAESDAGFFLSFLGFTCGVGLCEEVTKAIPLLLRIKSLPGRDDATWNTMLIWGVASGIGFGIAEAIMYSGRYYNGIEGSEIYYVRFISCVILHAIWAGAVGVTMYNRQDWLHNAANNWAYSGNVVLIVLVPMILHGLYDTLLKQDQEIWALVVAFASFGWLAFQIERMWHKPPEIVTA